MRTASVRRKTLLVLLTAILVAPWASAASLQPVSPRSVQAVGPAPLELFNRFWNFLRSVDSKEGCNIDPDGRCRSQNSGPTKAGCDIDPNGRCRSQTTPPQTKAGCNIDPNGRCLP